MNNAYALKNYFRDFFFFQIYRTGIFYFKSLDFDLLFFNIIKTLYISKQNKKIAREQNKGQ